MKDQKFSFQSKLESISDELEYFAFSVPEKITLALKTKAAVPILAQVNDSPKFRVRHFFNPFKFKNSGK